MDWEKYNNKTPIFTLEGSFVQGKIVDVYDGDTVKIVLNLSINQDYFRWNCRLSGINTPEIRTKNTKEKEFGLLVRDKLKERIENKILLIKCGEFDKYGRLLVEIYENNGQLFSINNWLIENNYAKPYDGGTKEEWFTPLKI
jgi:endonuclease YncB( thermonuclease family)